MLMQNFEATNKEHYGMLWYFLEWSINLVVDCAFDSDMLQDLHKKLHFEQDTINAGF